MSLFDKLFNHKQGIVNVRMVITEEKILSNIEKVQKMINPKSKKQIVQLEEDSYFKDLVESIKTYLEEYPKKKNFPRSVYKAAYDLVEFATNQFEENTKKIEELIIQREKNISSAFELKTILSKVLKKEEGYEQEIENASVKFSDDIGESLKILSQGTDDEEKKSARKLIDARINNLESNFHIEIDMERLEDSSKALSFIGIEVSDALKLIPTPEDNTQTIVEEEVEPEVQNIEEVVETKKKAKKVKAKKEKVKANVQTIEENNEVEANEAVEEAQEELNNYKEETTFKAKPSLWQRFKNSKIVRAATYVFRIRIRIELPSNALPEGRGENE